MSKPTQHHFDVAIGLAMGLLLIVQACEVYNAVWVEHRAIGVSLMSHTFETLLGVGLGIMRGMLPDSPNNPTPAMADPSERLGMRPLGPRLVEKPKEAE